MKKLFLTTIILASIGVGTRMKGTKKSKKQYRFFVYELENHTMQEKLNYMINFLEFHNAEYVNHEINENQLTIICKLPLFNEVV